MKKQYDAYLLYWSNRHNKMVNSYVSSLLIGHCKSDDLVEKYNEFDKIMQLDSNYLLHVGIYGPNVNLSFECKLAIDLEEMDITLLRIGSRSLHAAHTAFRKGIKKFYSGKVNAKESQYFDLDDFFNDIHFFFKLSSARREDYSSLEAIKNVVVEYVQKHTEAKRLSMKYVTLRCLDQWINLKEYFLNFLPKQKNFKHEISKAQRYVCIKAALEEPLTDAYLSFCTFVAHDFESFLLPFQTKEAMIHLLYTSMCKLLSDPQSKCIKKKVLSSESCENIDLGKKENLKPVNLIDIGAKAKAMFAGLNFSG